MPSRLMEAILSHQEVTISEHQEIEQGQVLSPGAGLEQPPVLQVGRWRVETSPAKKDLGQLVV